VQVWLDPEDFQILSIRQVILIFGLLAERAFRRILGRIGIDEEKRKARNLVFHGLRHSYVSITRATGLPDFAVMRLAGHKTLAMTERYSHSENVVDFAAARLAINGAVSKAGGAV
jgi:integrase